MPVYSEEMLSPADLHNLVAYLESLNRLTAV